MLKGIAASEGIGIGKIVTIYITRWVCFSKTFILSFF